LAESEHVNKQPYAVRVRGRVARSVLLFFLAAPAETVFTTTQIARKLQFDYNAVWSALRRLCGGSLLIHLNRGFVLVEKRRAVAQAAYDAEGRAVSKEDGICSHSLPMVPQVATSTGESDPNKVSPVPEESEIEMRVGLKKHTMDEGIDRRAAWIENAIVRTYIDLYIAGKLRTHCNKNAGRGSRSHQTIYSCEQFTIILTHKGHVSLWPKKPDCRLYLDRWLVDAGLDEDNRRLFWSSVDRAWPQTKATLEAPLKLQKDDDVEWFFHDRQDPSIRGIDQGCSQSLQKQEGDGETSQPALVGKLLGHNGRHRCQCLAPEGAAGRAPEDRADDYRISGQTNTVARGHSRPVTEPATAAIEGGV